jgi:hypothetical protein
MADVRGLTSGESRICKAIFRDTIPTGAVRIKVSKVIYGGFTPFHNIIVSPESHSDDYIGNNLRVPTAGASDAHFFLHELSHVWQYYVGMPKLLLYCRASREGRKVQKSRPSAGERGAGRGSFYHQAGIYSYRIDKKGLDLLDFNMEQQCEIIADYFAQTLWGYRQEEMFTGWPVATHDQLLGVLSNFNQDPAYPRRQSRGNERRAGRRD